MTPLYLSIPVLIWLSVCAWFDWRSRRVSNWLTLPALAFAVIARATGYGTGGWRLVWLLTILVVIGWAANLIGGADAKGSLVMILLDPRLAVWAWAGAVIWYLTLIIFIRGREKPFYLPGMLGFVIGVFANVCTNFVLWEPK